jgi:uncharacterized protein YjbI with pentapeptide repeats
LIGAKLVKANMGGAILKKANLRKADLRDVFLAEANLTAANLSKAFLGGTRLPFANLVRADLTDSHLISASFSYAKLAEALLIKANLADTNFRRADLSGANLANAEFGGTILGSTNLRGVIGLETCDHLSPSVIDIHTIVLSGMLPLRFLRGCGLPDTLIEFLPSLLNDPIQFYASFISYSSKDQKFADRLYADLQNKGMRCWLATEDLKIGAKIRTGIDEAIRLHDKLLLVLTKHSVASDWVEQEVETALERERKEKRLILFPIRLDDAVMKIEGGWPALIRNTRNIGDFRKWKDHDSYQKTFARLLRDLKAEDKQTTEG